ncbi:hypothetical protein WEI85_01655 [Actinomycetes bacterium KLBMP 9797]
MSLPSPTVVPEVAVPPSRLHRVANVTLRVIGGAIAVIAAVLTAVLELLFATLRINGHLIGASVLLAVVANIALGWFAYVTVGRKAAILLPAGAWLVFMVVASGRTAEGDLLLVGPEGGAVVDGNSWVGVAMIFAGAIAFAIVAFRAILTPRSTTPMIKASL